MRRSTVGEPRGDRRHRLVASSGSETAATTSGSPSADPNAAHASAVARGFGDPAGRRDEQHRRDEDGDDGEQLVGEHEEAVAQPHEPVGQVGGRGVDHEPGRAPQREPRDDHHDEADQLQDGGGGAAQAEGGARGDGDAEHVAVGRASRRGRGAIGPARAADAPGAGGEVGEVGSVTVSFRSVRPGSGRRRRAGASARPNASTGPSAPAASAPPAARVRAAQPSSSPVRV